MRTLKVYHLRDLVWTKEFLTLPGSHKRYSLHHLYISTDAQEIGELETGAEVKPFVLKHHRTQEVLCLILVDADEFNDYRNFENQLLDARLP